MPIFGQKHVDSVKTTLYYELKKSIGCPFFQIFHEKLTALMPLFCYKNVNILQTLYSYAHILSKNVNSLQKQCSHVIFSKFLYEKPNAVMPIYG